jgi:hypothetical protein
VSDLRGARAGADGERTTHQAARDEHETGKHSERCWPDDQRPHRYNLTSLGSLGRLIAAAAMTLTLCIVGQASHRCA